MPSELCLKIFPLIYFVFRSYKDALEAGLFTAKPYEVFDKNVCAVKFTCLCHAACYRCWYTTSLAISEHHFAILIQHTGRPDISYHLSSLAYQTLHPYSRFILHSFYNKLRTITPFLWRAPLRSVPFHLYHVLISILIALVRTRVSVFTVASAISLFIYFLVNTLAIAPTRSIYSRYYNPRFVGVRTPFRFDSDLQLLRQRTVPPSIPMIILFQCVPNTHLLKCSTSQQALADKCR
jgi:hypothetical protein